MKSKSILSPFLTVLVTLLFSWKSAMAATPASPAFPGAEGFGALATGGSGGQNYCVTNLDDSGPGTFRDAISQPHRVITFGVDGVIHLKSNLSACNDLTILGETAPGDGIAVYGHSISFSDCTNIIVRYLRFREGITGDQHKCSINIANGGDMIFDHVSVEWGRWDCLGLTRGSHDVTFQYCIFGQGINPQRFGALVDTVTDITFSHNLWVDNESRNPKAKGTIQYINNVVYNWGVNGLVGGHSATNHELDVIGNYFIKGPSSNNHFVGMFTATDHVFQQDNYFSVNSGSPLGGHLITNDEFRNTGGPAVFASTPFLTPPVRVTTDSAAAGWQKVIAGVGCSQHRDAVDRAIIAEVMSLGKNGRIIADESGKSSSTPATSEQE